MSLKTTPPNPTNSIVSIIWWMQISDMSNFGFAAGTISESTARPPPPPLPPPGLEDSRPVTLSNPGSTGSATSPPLTGRNECPCRWSFCFFWEIRYNTTGLGMSSHGTEISISLNRKAWSAAAVE